MAASYSVRLTGWTMMAGMKGRLLRPVAAAILVVIGLFALLFLSWAIVGLGIIRS